MHNKYQNGVIGDKPKTVKILNGMGFTKAIFYLKFWQNIFFENTKLCPVFITFISSNLLSCAIIPNNFNFKHVLHNVHCKSIMIFLQ